MEYIKHFNESNCDIVLNGRFTFNDHAKFREVFGLLSDGKISSLSIDFTNLEFIDSAGLGILLLLRDEAAKKKLSLTFKNPVNQVHKMFKISKFYDLFHII
jgi:anti-anti-sigma factor